MFNEDKDILKELRDLTRNKENWQSNIDNVASKLNSDCSIEIKAKALWLLGEMGLKYPDDIGGHIEDVAGYLEDDDAQLRERSANAIGRIGRADKNLAIPYIDKLMKPSVTMFIFSLNEQAQDSGIFYHEPS